MGGTLRDLVRRFHGTGRLGAIVLRPDRLKDAVSVQEARAEPGLGLIGDHRSCGFVSRMRNAIAS